MDTSNHVLIKQINKLDILIFDALSKEYINEIYILLEERGRLIEELKFLNSSFSEDLIAPLIVNTNEISRQLQQITTKIENAVQSTVLSASAKKAYEISMFLNNRA